MPDTERWGRVRCDGLTHLGLRQLVITHAAVRESLAAAALNTTAADTNTNTSNSRVGLETGISMAGYRNDFVCFTSLDN